MDIAERTAKALQVQLLGSDRAALRTMPSTSWEAYESHLQGMAAFQRTADQGWTRQGLEQAAHFFEAAMSKDPTFVPPYAYLANLLIAGMGECVSKAEVADRVQELVATALRLGPEDSMAHTARGNYALQFELDWKRAEEEFRAAIRLNPSSVPAHAWYGIMLIVTRRFEEALHELELAGDLDPLFRNLTYWQIRARERMNDLSGAAALARTFLGRDPADRHLHILLADLLLRDGKEGEARREIELAAGPIRGASTAVRRAEVLCALGDPSEARDLVRAWDQKDTEYYRPAYIARLLAALGEKERALTLLEEDSHGGERSLWIDYQNRSFDSLRQEPRFVALLREMNLAS